MKKTISYIYRFVIVSVLIVISMLLGMKIFADVKNIKIYEEDSLNVEAESRFFIDTITRNLSEIQNQIERDVGKSVELADTGTMQKIELFFVVKVDNGYKYIVSKNVDGTQKFAIAENETETGKYIITCEDLGLKDCVFTNINGYMINRDGIVSYIN